ncbi:hypothetical protein CDAR_199481 [Caerostris darwini]|uniref:Uncharacterized protein n=1 Tax=Caerostris darwini TaxID=1538125 RepID=A0AAV4M8N2_9ARAC|nr:hypothetical protein CDAR_199481 [Caerostris darwini]
MSRPVKKLGGHSKEFKDHFSAICIFRNGHGNAFLLAYIKKCQIAQQLHGRDLQKKQSIKKYDEICRWNSEGKLDPPPIKN